MEKIMRKNKNPQLGPIVLSKSQYKPYVSTKKILPIYQSPNNYDIGVSIINDMPPPEQTSYSLPQRSNIKLRNMIREQFENRDPKLEQKWIHYTMKTQICKDNSEWQQLQRQLLTIIVEWLKKQNQLNQKVSYMLNNTQINNSIQNKFRSTEASFKKLQKLHHTQFYKTNKLELSQIKMHQKLAHNNLTTMNFPKKNKISDEQTMILRQISNGKSSLCQNNLQRSQNNSNQTLKMQVVRLQKKIEILQNQQKQKQANYQQQIKRVMANCNHDLQQKYFLLREQKSKYQSELQGKKFHNNIITRQFANLKDKYMEIQKKYKEIQIINEKQNIKKQKLREMSQYRQLWLMENQELQQLKQSIKQLECQKDNQVKKNQGFKQKLKELSKNFNYNYNVLSQNQRDKQDLKKVLKEFREWLKFIGVPRISNGMMNRNTFFPQLIGPLQSSQYVPKQDPTNYQLLRPNFFIYFENYESIILAQKKFPQRKIMPPQFFLTIRSIMDAMFMHFNFASNINQWKNFPEFTISYFEKFEIHPQQRIAVVRKSSCEGQQKINFLLNVFNLQAANTWQCDLFRSFLLEEYSLDEVYFYLDCRNSLLGGPHLNNNFGSADTITYIKAQKAKDIVEEKLQNYDNQMVQKIKKFIDSKKKNKTNDAFVDLNFVLKLLLEVYSIEKIKSQRFFYNTFRTQDNDSKITYTAYSTFMAKNFTFLLKSDIAKLYRQTYTLGVGKVTYKTIHYICLMKGLFIPLLQKKLITTKNRSIPRKSKLFDDTLNLNLQNQANKITQIFEYIGFQDLIGFDLIVNRFLNEIPLLSGNKQLFEMRYFDILNKISKIKSVISWRNSRLKKQQNLANDGIRERISHILAYTYQCLYDINDLKKQKDQRNNAIRKLTRNFKIRIQQSFLEFSLPQNKISQKLLQLSNSNNEQNQAKSQSGEQKYQL